jgi:hypothetical protein
LFTTFTTCLQPQLFTKANKNEAGGDEWTVQEGDEGGDESTVQEPEPQVLEVNFDNVFDSPPKKTSLNTSTSTQTQKDLASSLS